MEFKPKSKQEIQEAKLTPKGVYAFEVLSAEDKSSSKEIERASKAGVKPSLNMIALELAVFVNDKKRSQRVWIGTWGGGEELMYSFCEATGLVELYLAGKLKASDCLDMSGYVQIKHEERKDTKELQSSVHLFIPKEGVAAVRAKLAGGKAPVENPVFVATPTSDDVPF